MEYRQGDIFVAVRITITDAAGSEDNCSHKWHTEAGDLRPGGTALEPDLKKRKDKIKHCFRRKSPADGIPGSAHEDVEWVPGLHHEDGRDRHCEMGRAVPGETAQKQGDCIQGPHSGKACFPKASFAVGLFDLSYVRI